MGKSNQNDFNARGKKSLLGEQEEVSKNGESCCGNKRKRGGK